MCKNISMASFTRYLHERICRLNNEFLWKREIIILIKKCNFNQELNRKSKSVNSHGPKLILNTTNKLIVTRPENKKNIFSRKHCCKSLTIKINIFLYKLFRVCSEFSCYLVDTLGEPIIQFELKSQKIMFGIIFENKDNI